MVSLRTRLFCQLLTLCAVALPSARADFAATLQVAVDKPDRTLGMRLYGANVEHMFNAIEGGLWGELLVNRKLMPPGDTRTVLPAPWFPFGDPESTVVLDAPKQDVRNGDLAHSLRLEAPEGGYAGVAQAGLALRPGDRARLSLLVRGSGAVKLTASLGDALASVTEVLPPPTHSWQKVTATLELPRAAREARLTLTLTGPGIVWLYAPSLMREAALAADGFEPAVLARARALNPQFLRYPGGNFAQNYRWRDGIGPRDERPLRPNVWGGRPEPNDVGTDEFLALCRRLKAEPVLVVNVGGLGATARDAADWVAYCNAPADTEMGRLRAANGRVEPYNVRTWEIGNEIYGEWTSGHTDAAAYAENFDAYVRAMRAVDPAIQVVAVGQTPEWNQQVLSTAKTAPDLLSLHLYVAQATPTDVLAEPIAYEAFLHTVGKGAPRLAVSEWALNMKEDNKTWLGGMFAASLLNVFQRTPQVEMAAVNGLVNGWEGGIVRRDGRRLYATPAHAVLSLYRRHTGTQGLPITLRAGSLPALRSEELDLAYPALDIVASRDAGGRVYLCVVNKSGSETALLSFVLAGYKPKRGMADVWTLQGSPTARNDFSNPERFQPIRRSFPVQGGRFTHRFPPFSVTCIGVS